VKAPGDLLGSGSSAGDDAGIKFEFKHLHSNLVIIFLLTSFFAVHNWSRKKLLTCQTHTHCSKQSRCRFEAVWIA
ncbi:MAG TPA: hypothetical protein PKZ46_05880, partial [Candidatus Cloacimonadota bacterium]|nr:hypothetical protein [Candidatus Cloacimonadota bacterium]